MAVLGPHTRLCRSAGSEGGGGAGCVCGHGCSASFSRLLEKSRQNWIAMFWRPWSVRTWTLTSTRPCTGGGVPCCATRPRTDRGTAARRTVSPGSWGAPRPVAGGGRAEGVLLRAEGGGAGQPGLCSGPTALVRDAVV